MPYYTYMLASRRYGTLYIGVTNDIGRRVYEHKTKATSGFTSQYDVDKLVWYEVYYRIVDAILREKTHKKWRRDWKIRLIEEDNPNWLDLYDLLAQLQDALALYVFPGRRRRARNPGQRGR